MTVQFVQIKSDSPDVTRVQQNITNVINQIQGLFLGEGTSTVENVFLNVDYIAVNHGLGRPPNGFVVLSSNVPEQISTGTTTVPVAPKSTNPSRYIYLTTNGGPCVCTILFY